MQIYTISFYENEDIGGDVVEWNDKSNQIVTAARDIAVAICGDAAAGGFWFKFNEAFFETRIHDDERLQWLREQSAEYYVLWTDSDMYEAKIAIMDDAKALLWKLAFSAEDVEAS